MMSMIFVLFLSHTSDLKIGTPVDALPGAWRNRVSAGAGCLGAGMLRLGEFDLQLLSQCGSTYSRLSRSVPEIHKLVVGTLSNQQTTCQYGCL